MTRFYGARVGNQYLGPYPLEGRISSLFGARDIAAHRNGHTGVDIAASGGTLIRAPQAGKVWYVEAGNPTFGNWCILEHGEGALKQYSLYGHMLDHPHVDVGEWVEIGDKLGRVGSTGVSTGNHLHWGHAWKENPWHRRQGKLFDPLMHLYTPDQRMGDPSPAIGRVPLIMAVMKSGLEVKPQPRDFNGRPSWLVKPGGKA